MSDLVLEDVQRLRLEPNDILVLTLPRTVTMEHRQQVVDHLASWNVRALVLDPDTALQVLSSAAACCESTAADSAPALGGPVGRAGATPSTDGGEQ